MTARMRAAQASDKLTMALLAAASRGNKIPCGDYSIAYLFLSEHEPERQLAIRACHGCPVFEPCGEAADANRETFGVRAGKDYTRRPGQKKAS